MNLHSMDPSDVNIEGQSTTMKTKASVRPDGSRTGFCALLSPKRCFLRDIWDVELVVRKISQ